VPDKLKICVCSEFPPPYGGIGVQASLLSGYLEKDGCTVKRLDSNLPKGFFLIAAGKIRGIRGILRTFLFTWRCIVEFRDVDIVHILSGSFLNFFLYTTPAVVVGKFWRKAVIIHYHGGAAESFLRRHSIWAKRILRMADTVITPSGFLSQVFVQHNIDTKIIPNIIVLKDFIFNERKEITPCLLITRHLEPEYNVMCALKAFDLIWKYFPDAVLTIVGSGSEETVLKEFTDKLRCRKAISFLGRVDHGKINSLYHEHDILLNTSYVDNQPLSLIEAMACGLVVVSTNAGGIPFMVEHKKTGLLVERNDYVAIADEVVWLLNNQRAAIDIINRAVGEIEKYSWKEVSNELFSIYDHVLTASNATHAS